MSVNVNDNGILRKIAGGTLYADLPIGAEIMYEGTAVPNGYLACNGSTFSQSEYPDLYAVLGSTTLPNRSGYIIRAKYNVLPLDLEKNLSHRNILDNPFFTVNQRGFSSVSNPTSDRYLVDRWLTVVPSGATALGSITLTNGCLAYNNTSGDRHMVLRQYIESASTMYGRTITASVMLEDGSVASATGVVPLVKTSEWQQIILFSVTSDVTMYVYLLPTSYAADAEIEFHCKAGGSITYKAVKVEVGSTSTLVNDVAPNYTLERLKCQRYFYRLKTTAGKTFPIAVGYALNATTFRGALYLPVPMRVIPTATVSDLSKYRIIGQGQSNVTPSAIAVDGMDGTILFVRADVTGLNGYQSYALADLSDSNTLDFSADL